MQFSQWRLLPMGSYPRVADARGTYDLFGPVSKFLCASYDRAQAGYLACLAEFAAWLRARGASDGGGNPFQVGGWVGGWGGCPPLWLATWQCLMPHQRGLWLPPL